MPLIQDLNVDQLKVPLGFIKIPQLVLAIIAFSARSGWRFAVEYTCDGAKPFSITFDDFLINEKFKKCGNGADDRILDIDHTTAANFFGMIAILSIIYVLMALYVYLFKWGLYAGDERVPKIDLVATCILAIWWFLAAFIWWRSTSSLEKATDKKTVENRFRAANVCGENRFDKCDFNSYADYATLTVSVLAGFGCLLLWASNIYYAYKETTWFRDRKPQPSAMNSTGMA